MTDRCRTSRAPTKRPRPAAGGCGRGCGRRPAGRWRSPCWCWRRRSWRPRCRGPSTPPLTTRCAPLSNGPAPPTARSAPRPPPRRTREAPPNCASASRPRRWTGRTRPSAAPSTPPCAWRPGRRRTGCATPAPRTPTIRHCPAPPRTSPPRPH
ncbi:hypothetical protein DQ392_26265 [Streptomyces reniochalinae]|uniref:Uncharacterized protein n=1 Tax=Streptomyces reniochalinae TaxID=2250578 RepID=A0A367EA75_9ACTN|nr:hypothetical protein DQ392_26265 [Streptomyces reniochalinae]